MDRHQKAALEKLAGKGIRFNYPMHQRTTYQVGGPVEVLWEARDLLTLKEVIRYLSGESIPYHVLGKGSNLLVTDDGIDGVMILLKGSLATINKGPEDSLIWAGGGLHLTDLMKWCRQKGMSGLEFMAGIPGTVGGAVVMNAGAFGHAIGEKVRNIQCVVPGGKEVLVNRSDLKFSYRRLHVQKNSAIINACLELSRSTPDKVSLKMGDFLKTRKETQPLDAPSAGSVFKNPPGDHAGRLIEKAGLKGRKIGDAMVSEKHANYILNKGNATAKDILSLMELVRFEVKRTSGIDLEPEIKIVGKKA
ncbi:UDP-N-acetylmuramate dehydrogenase [delta proteobacterium NaphS2]|nr:UDP-N-acetylmuramate dehydrogenase [delta proteobacterium NaphS2]